MQFRAAGQAKLYLDRQMTEVDLHPIAGGLAVVFSCRCPGKETPNEDAAALIPYGPMSGLIVVADGMGGGHVGEQAAEIAVDALQTAVSQAAETGEMLRTAVLNGIEHANAAVQDLGVGAATTLAVVEVDDGLVRPYHVGDSMILVVGQRGRVKLQTVCHSPVGFAVEAGLLDPDEAMHHKERHLVSNVIGTPEMRIEIGPPLKLAPLDTLLIATDGLFDNLSVDEVLECVRKGSICQAAHRLVEDAHRRMTSPAAGQPSKPDDMTFVVFRRESTGADRANDSESPENRCL